jgi:hypothetical protein
MKVVPHLDKRIWFSLIKILVLPNLNNFEEYKTKIKLNHIYKTLSSFMS